MIQPLRTVHRRTFYAMAMVVPIIFLLGLSRREPQLKEEMVRPAALSPNEHAWPHGLLATSRNGETTITRVSKPLSVPDPLLYCSDDAITAGDLPLDAVLVGPVRAGNAVESRCRGRLIFYSLGHRVVVDEFPVEGLP